MEEPKATNESVSNAERFCLSDKMKGFFTFKLFLKLLAIIGIFLSCLLASTVMLIRINAVFGVLSTLIFVYLFVATIYDNKLYYNNTKILLFFFAIINFMMALIFGLDGRKWFEKAVKPDNIESYINEMKNDAYFPYFISGVIIFTVACFMLFSIIFVVIAHKHASGSDDINSRNPARPLYYFTSLSNQTKTKC